ncbi:MAG TPA: lipid-transfer protein [Spongiibacteraceae bacterium]|nr:lipid-transfer protein [Spongiibacteraceae bacterium]
MIPLNDTAIVGIGQTEFSKRSGRSELQLAAEASNAALHDAGLSPADIDGMVTFTLDNNDELALQRCLGIERLTWTARGPFGGGAASATVQMAAAAVASGAAKAVLVYRAFNERSGQRFGQPGGYGIQFPDIHFSFGLDTPAKIYSLWYQRYMHKYGVTNEDLGRYVVIARAHAATNPAAWYYEKPITLEDHQRSRWIVEPMLRLLDCCQESDGGVAFIVTSAERARDLRQPGVRIEAAAQSHLLGGDIMFDYYRKDLADFAELQDISQQLWHQSGLTPDDIDVAMLYENFSPVVFMSLEGHGFCKPGEAKDFIKDGHICLDGKLPVNTNGGLLGEGYIHGVNNVLEGVRQVRGTAANQIAGAEHVLVSAGRSAAILGKL